MKVNVRMYPEDAGAEPAPAGPTGRVTRNLEALIPLILIVIIAAFLGHKFGFWTIPFLGGADQVQMIVIGEPSVDLLADLDNQRDLVYYRVRHASELDAAPQDILAQYDIVLLDQHMGTTPYDKSVSRTLGEALQNYVKGGGKLIVVMDSGIYRSGGIYGTAVATDVTGWEATFGDIIPVQCDTGPNEMKTCTVPIATTGKIYRQDFDHKIMKGIEVAPSDPRYGPLSIVTFDVKPVGQQVAYIKHIATASNYPGIVEKKMIIGKSIYFNYDPAMTPGIWQNTLEYLR